MRRNLIRPCSPLLRIHPERSRRAEQGPAAESRGLRRRVKVKVCGITNLRDARAAVAAGADFLGFVFYKKSPRYIAPVKAFRLISCLPRTVRKVGVFVNEDKERVKAIAAACGLDMVQFHGTETPAYVNAFKACRVIKAVRVKGRRSLEGLDKYRADFFLLDTFRKGRFGGTGERFPWKLLAPLAQQPVRHKLWRTGRIPPRGRKDNGAMGFSSWGSTKKKTKFIVSGGLTPDNVGELLQVFKPYAVDVSSGVEKAPGKKDIGKIRQFIQKAKKAAVSPIK
ncbi:MAG: phosphoribosylanthranilate isomerase [Candidatus Omnitrophica bacterium]|nr:phosphoribosylanthranilate isomerase [Candidatus Omnitrophota bacterium]